VPQDFATITQALDICPPGGTICLLPGVYKERISISKSVRICAADPIRGAAIVWHNNDNKTNNQCAIDIEDSCTYVSLRNLTILHFSRGSDIWNGNCAVRCHGNLTHSVLDGCSIQSDSGRGIVITNGASLKMVRSTVHDCAATGLYVGDLDSILEISHCNILRNGFGAPPTVEELEEDPPTPTVPSGHSGLYVEAAEAEIRNILLAGNCLTGLSVVRHGMVHISGSDITGNGQEPIVVFDESNESADGGVYEHSNNFETVPPEGTEGLLRCTGGYHKVLTKSILDKMYTD
jgi:hypothetical protein